MYNSEIQSIKTKINNLNNVKIKMTTVISQANDTISNLTNANTITESLIIGGQSIDQGTLKNALSTCQKIVQDANDTISNCNEKISQLERKLRIILEKRRKEALNKQNNNTAGE